MGDNQLTVVTPQMNSIEFQHQRNTIIDFVSQAMSEGTDYGIIPGTQKQSLWKPGAEKLLRLFGMSASFELLKEVEDFDKPFFYYKYRCTLTHVQSGMVVGNAERSCNSHEKKYRFIKKPEKWATDEEKSRAIRKEKNKKFNSYDLVLEKTPAEAADDVNTVQAMAQKRAMVAVTSQALSATEIFGEETADVDGQYERIKLMRRLHVVAAERGFDHDFISKAAKKKHRVKSTSELTEDQLQDMIDNMEMSYEAVGKGNKPKKITQADESVQDQPDTRQEENIEDVQEGEIVEETLPKSRPAKVKDPRPWEKGFSNTREEQS